MGLVTKLSLIWLLASWLLLAHPACLQVPAMSFLDANGQRELVWESKDILMVCAMCAF